MFPHQIYWKENEYVNSSKGSIINWNVAQFLWQISLRSYSTTRHQFIVKKFNGTRERVDRPYQVFCIRSLAFVQTQVVEWQAALWEPVTCAWLYLEHQDSFFNSILVICDWYMDYCLLLHDCCVFPGFDRLIRAFDRFIPDNIPVTRALPLKTKCTFINRTLIFFSYFVSFNLNQIFF